jgi:hypothetical protein
MTIFYWIAARIVLQWGGLLSLHYAMNPPERLPGHTSSSSVHWDGSMLTFDELPEPDPGKMAFVRELAHTRTRLAHTFLGHGRLLRPIPLSTGTVAMDFSQRYVTMPAVHHHGTRAVPAA